MKLPYWLVLISCLLVGAIVVRVGFWHAAKTESARPATLFQWEDYMNPPFLADYEKQFGEKPNIAMFADEDEAFAKMRAGYHPDVMGPCYYEFPRWREAGLLQPIDTTKLKNWNKISPTLRNLPGIAAGPNTVWFVPQYWGNTSIAFRTDLAPEYVKSPSWSILFDPKYRGRVSLLDGVDDTVPFIAHMFGIDPYNMTPAQYAFVRAKLKEAVAQSRLISSEDTALTQGLASGELVAAMSWRIVYSTLHKEGRPVAYMNPPGGMLTFVCGLVMHKDPSDERKALALIDSSLSDLAATYIIEQIGDEPANEVALRRVGNATFEELGLTRDVESFLKSGIFEKRLRNKEQIVNDWTEIRAGL